LSTLAASQAAVPRTERDAIRDPREPRSALRTLLTEARPEVRCADATRCPPSVGLVVFPGREPDLTGRIPPVRCTGTLVAPDRVLTASHCLTTPRCDDAWVAFPATTDHEAAVARCVRVLAQDPDTQDGVLLQDWALLLLERPLPRPFATLASEAVREGTIVTVASVTPHPIYGSQHQLEARLCRAETSEAAEARLGAEARRVGWLSGCPIEPGNSGSPVLDAEGRLRALVHAGSHPVFGIGVTTALPERLGR
ncbi:MAG: trypsin-like peptidase domain-containing protein, partial [Myxococcales bacterium]|nr:trypsin-like peptidase domain-containing protein [Myxococcales bacterium]